jgi:hypothetical protein
MRASRSAPYRTPLAAIPDDASIESLNWLEQSRP